MYGKAELMSLEDREREHSSKQKELKPPFTPKLATNQELLLHKGLIPLQEATPSIKLERKNTPLFHESESTCSTSSLFFFFWVESSLNTRGVFSAFISFCKVFYTMQSYILLSNTYHERPPNVRYL